MNERLKFVAALVAVIAVEGHGRFPMDEDVCSAEKRKPTFQIPAGQVNTAILPAFSWRVFAT
jgi:hypothetical protein